MFVREKIWNGWVQEERKKKVCFHTWKAFFQSVHTLCQFTLFLSVSLSLSHRDRLKWVRFVCYLFFFIILIWLVLRLWFEFVFWFKLSLEFRWRCLRETRFGMDEWRKKEKKKWRGEERSASETRWRKRKNLSAGHKEWRREE